VAMGMGFLQVQIWLPVPVPMAKPAAKPVGIPLPVAFTMLGGSCVGHGSSTSGCGGV
jgi:hypothetical protein